MKISLEKKMNILLETEVEIRLMRAVLFRAYQALSNHASQSAKEQFEFAEKLYNNLY